MESKDRSAARHGIPIVCSLVLGLFIQCQLYSDRVNRVNRLHSDDPAQVEHVILSGQDPSEPGYGGMTALFTATCGNRVEVMRVLLRYGAGENKEDVVYCLRKAEERGFTEAARLLREYQ